MSQLTLGPCRSVARIPDDCGECFAAYDRGRKRRLKRLLPSLLERVIESAFHARIGERRIQRDHKESMLTRNEPYRGENLELTEHKRNRQNSQHGLNAT
jgi:hypothetical protein